MNFLEQFLPLLVSLFITTITIIVPIAIILWFLLKILKNQKEQLTLLKDILKKLDTEKKTNV